MADLQIGTIDNNFAVVNVGGSPNPTNLNGAGGAAGANGTDPQLGFDADNLDSISAMRARLAAINGTYYTAAVLNMMTLNDMQYAIRVSDFPATIKQQFAGQQDRWYLQRYSGVRGNSYNPHEQQENKVNEEQGQGAGMLTAMQDHWKEQGWELDTLNSFRMEMNNPGGDGGGQAGGQVSTGSVPAGNQQQGGTQGGQGQLSQDFGNPFLSEVDPAHKAIVEPYLQKWDSNVTKRFQDLHAKYQPYEQLGDVESLQQALYVQQLIDNDPQQVLNALAEALGVQVGPAQGLGQQQQGNQAEVPEEFEGLPVGFVQKFQQQQQALEAMAQMMLSNQQSAQEQAEDAELDNLISSLKQQHGEFDEEFVLAKMMSGAKPEDAIQAYNGLVQQAINQRGQQIPQIPILGGGGSIPQENNKGVTELSRNETKNLVANFLAAANNAQQ